MRSRDAHLRQCAELDAARAELERRGGVAYRADLPVRRRTLERALHQKRVVRLGRGRYCLPGTDPAQITAFRAGGVLSHLSAARAWGWKTKNEPRETHVTIPRRSRARTHRGTRLHWANLTPDELAAGRTDPLRTVLDCARTLPFDEALAVADSALRSGLVGAEELSRAAGRTWGPGSGQARRIATAASPLADNPFESVLRAICVQAGIAVTPQVQVAPYARVDLRVDGSRLVLEADSYGFHSSRQQLDRDIRRTNALILDGWVVLRFSWEMVMFEPDLVARTIVEALRRGQAPGRLLAV